MITSKERGGVGNYLCQKRRCRLIVMYVCMHVYLHACMSIYLHACMSIYLHACMSIYLHACISICMHVCLSSCMSACMYACLYACIYVIEKEVIRSVLFYDFLLVFIFLVVETTTNVGVSPA